jgi:hypothetical protein
MAGTAGLYANLLSTPEASAEIMDEAGVQLVERLTIGTTGRDGFIGVKATARDPEQAKRAALQSFTWLDERIADPLAIVRLVETEEITPSILDDDGRFVSAIRVGASPAFAETATGIWVSVTTAETPVTFSLADAAVNPAEQVAYLEPDSEMVIALEDIRGNPLDSMAIPVPTLPEPDTVPYVLSLHFGRGSIFSTTPPASIETSEPGTVELLTNPELVERHIIVSWEPVTAAGGDLTDEAPIASNAVGLLLLTEDPVALETGSRRGPVLILATLVGGFFALIAIAVTVDAWSRARKEGRAQAERPAAAELRGIDGTPKEVDGTPENVDGEAEKADKIRGTG